MNVAAFSSPRLSRLHPAVLALGALPIGIEGVAARSGSREPQEGSLGIVSGKEEKGGVFTHVTRVMLTAEIQRTRRTERHEGERQGGLHDAWCLVSSSAA